MPNCSAPASQKPASRRVGRPRQRVKGRNTSAAISTRASTAKSLSTRPARYSPIRLKEKAQSRVTMSRKGMDGLRKRGPR